MTVYIFSVDGNMVIGIIAGGYDAMFKSIENAAQKKFQNTISAKQGMSIYL